MVKNYVDAETVDPIPDERTKPDQTPKRKRMNKKKGCRSLNLLGMAILWVPTVVARPVSCYTMIKRDLLLLKVMGIILCLLKHGNGMSTAACPRHRRSLPTLPLAYSGSQAAGSDHSFMAPRRP